MNVPTRKHRRRIGTYPGTAVVCAGVAALIFLCPAFGAEPGRQAEDATTMTSEAGEHPGSHNGASDSVEIVNPYQDVDWQETGRYRMILHTAHLQQTKDIGGFKYTAHEMIDAYAGDGPDVVGNMLPEGEELHIFGPANNSPAPNLWPWNQLAEKDPSWENRDPAKVGGGVISLPVYEQTEVGDDLIVANTLIADHGENEGMFNDLTRVERIRQILTRDEYFLEDRRPIVVIAHPARYRSSADQYTNYIEDFETFSLQDGLIGFEALSKESHRRMRSLDLQLWDNLLTEFLGRDEPRPIWGVSDDDGFPLEWGNEVRAGRDMVRFNTLLMPVSEFNPADQRQSREAVVDRLFAGAWLMHERDGWDGTGPMAPIPQVHAINVSGQTITLDASGYDTIEWVSKGQVVGTGASYTVSESDIPYVRAQLFSGTAARMTGPGRRGNGIGDAAETYTQPFIVRRRNK